VVQIFHVEESGDFSLASGYVVPMAPLSIVGDAIFRQHRHSAFVAPNSMPGLRSEYSPPHCLGIRTERAAKRTTRHGSDIGYEIDYVTEATLTFPRPTPRP